MSASQTIVGHFSTDRESLVRVRTEFDKIVKESGEWTPEDEQLSRKDYLAKFVKFDNLME